MSDYYALRVFVALVLGGVLTYALYRKGDGSLRAEELGNEWLYSPIMSPLLLPIYIFLLVIQEAILGGVEVSMRALLATLLMVLPVICVYDILLLALLPLLRRLISARVISALWLLPNYLYLVFNFSQTFRNPRFVLRLREPAFYIVFAVWFIGAAAVMAVSLVKHFRFRRILLRDAVKIDDPNILAQWETLQLDAGFSKPKLKLVRSNQTQTPLSIGLVRATIRVVLPVRAYSSEELELIFRHELVHIRHRDSSAKLFLQLCTALMWFNPLMWIASAKCSDDLELSCDELVIRSSPEPTRRLYADLILSTAGDSRGFTTNLSSRAESLKYRLQSILAPHRRFYGAIIAGVMGASLLLIPNLTGLAYGDATIKELAFGGETSDIMLEGGVDVYVGENAVTYMRCPDEKALLDHIYGLRASKLVTGYRRQSAEGDVLILLRSSDDLMTVTVSREYLYLSHVNGKLSDSSRNGCFCLLEEPDFDYIRSLLAPEVSFASPFVPTLWLDFGEEASANGEYMAAGCNQCVKISSDGEKEYFSLEELYYPAKLSGFEVEEVRLLFPVLPEHFSVTVKELNGENSYSVEGDTLVSSTDAESDYFLPLAPYSAHYTVSVTTPYDGDRYETQFFFDVELPQE